MIFLVLASALIHRFREERERYMKLREGMHLMKNIVIFTELAYMDCTL